MLANDDACVSNVLPAYVFVFDICHGCSLIFNEKLIAMYILCCILLILSSIAVIYGPVTNTLVICVGNRMTNEPPSTFPTTTT